MLKSSRWRVLLVFSLIMAGTVIAVASLTPTPSLQLPWGNVEGGNLIFHGAAYGILVILGSMLRYRLRWVAVAVLVYSTVLEGLQYFVQGHQVYLSDLAANILGVFAGLAIVVFCRQQLGMPKPDG